MHISADAAIYNCCETSIQKILLTGFNRSLNSAFLMSDCYHFIDAGRTKIGEIVGDGLRSVAAWLSRIAIGVTRVPSHFLAAFLIDRLSIVAPRLPAQGYQAGPQSPMEGGRPAQTTPARW